MKFLVENKEKIIILTVRINELDWFLFLYFKTKLNENYTIFLISFFTKLYTDIGFVDFIQK